MLKGGAIFPIPVMDQVVAGREEAPLLHREVAGDLYHPLFMRMRCDPGDRYLPGAEPEKEPDVIGDEPSSRPDLGREEVVATSTWPLSSSRPESYAPRK